MHNLAHLINWIYANTDLTLSIGRARDIPEVQPILIAKGLSKTLNSMHPKGLAIDINFFEGDYYLFSDTNRKEKDFGLALPIAEHWETMDKNNRWGGRFNNLFDPYHFENYFP